MRNTVLSQTFDVLWAEVVVWMRQIVRKHSDLLLEGKCDSHQNFSRETQFSVGKHKSVAQENLIEVFNSIGVPLESHRSTDLLGCGIRMSRVSL